MLTIEQVLTKEFKDILSGAEYESAAEAARILNVDINEIKHAISVNSLNGAIIPVKNQILVSLEPSKNTENNAILLSDLGLESLSDLDARSLTDLDLEPIGDLSSEIEANIKPYEINKDKKYRKGIALIDVLSNQEYLSFTHAADMLGVPLRELNKELNENGSYKTKDGLYDIRFKEGYNPATLRAIKRNVCRLLRQNGKDVTESKAKKLNYQFSSLKNNSWTVNLSYKNQENQEISSIKITK